MSKDKYFIYSKCVPEQRGRSSAQNTFSRPSALPKMVEKTVVSPFTALKKFISPDIVKQIVESTKAYAASKGKIFLFNESHFWLWVGANLFTGIMKGKNTSLEEIWNEKTGIPYLSKSKFSIHLEFCSFLSTRISSL